MKYIRVYWYWDMGGALVSTPWFHVIVSWKKRLRGVMPGNSWVRIIR